MKIVLLSGGVGGARLARGLGRILQRDLTVVVNTGDDAVIYGLTVSPDLDTVMYTMSGIEGPDGWGLADDRFSVMDHMNGFEIDTSFRIGDADLATNLYRSQLLSEGVPLSEVTRRLGSLLQLIPEVLPMSDQRVSTAIQIDGGDWLSFREYFVTRQHRDRVRDVRFEGVEDSTPAPGVLEALSEADAVVIGPSNPVLSIWPILAVPGIAAAVASAPRVIAVSPLFGGEALKGPAHIVMADVGLARGNLGVIQAYDGLVRDLVIDTGDASERSSLTASDVTIHVRSTMLTTAEQSTDFAEWLLDLVA